MSSDNQEKADEIRLHKELASEYVRRRRGQGSKIFDDYWNSRMIAALDVYPKGDVLDCCCGDGILLPALCDTYERVVGLDISEDMLALAKARAGDRPCELIRGDVEALPFADNTFDAVTFRGAFHHVPSPETCLREVRRVLRPGGGVVFVEPNGDPLVWRTFRSFYYKASRKFSSTHRYYRRAELCRLLEQAELDPVETRNIFLMAYPFAGLSDHFGFFERIPLHAWLTRSLVRLDDALIRLPVFRGLGFALMVVAEKR